MIRVLHAALMRRPYSGIIQQMSWENDAARSLNIPWSAKIFAPEWHSPTDSLFQASNSVGSGQETSLAARVRMSIRFRKEYYRWLAAEQRNYDLLVLRHNPADILQGRFINRLRKPVYLIYHTKPIPELLSNKHTIALAKGCVEWISGRESARGATGLVGVTREIRNHVARTRALSDKAKWVYPNGTRLRSKALARSGRALGEPPTLVFVSSYFYSWQGLDLVLKSAVASSAEFLLHVIGAVEPTDVKLAANDPRIVFHGHVDVPELHSILATADVGLSAFCLDRKGMHEACTLKTREYLGSGIPVYAGHRDVFPEHFPFYRCGKPEISSILNYALDVRRAESAAVLKAAAPYIDKKLLLKEFYGFLETEALKRQGAQ
jgi:hypothetical protein